MSPFSAGTFSRNCSQRPRLRALVMSICLRSSCSPQCSILHLKQPISSRKRANPKSTMNIPQIQSPESVSNEERAPSPLRACVCIQELQCSLLNLDCHKQLHVECCQRQMRRRRNRRTISSFGGHHDTLLNFLRHRSPAALCLEFVLARPFRRRRWSSTVVCHSLLRV